jgi:phosphohistidine phosphatase SixA
MVASIRSVALAAVTLLAFSVPADAQNQVFLVRHAERADTANGGPAMMGSDPSLSEAGRARAAGLATALKDAGITTIFVTEYKRTQETAAPLAKALGLTPVVVKANDRAGLLSQVRSAKGHVLVVGHSNTVPDAINALGVAATITIADAEYDNLFVVLPHGAQLVRLRYR